MTRLTQTHIFVTLEVSRSVYDEVERLLIDAGYNHVFVDGAIDMHGIGLVRKNEDDAHGETPREPGPRYNLTSMLVEFSKAPTLESRKSILILGLDVLGRYSTSFHYLRKSTLEILDHASIPIEIEENRK